MPIHRNALAALLILASAALAHAEPPPVFARCAVCHNAAKGAPDKIGPNLWGVYGKRAGVGKFAYSPQMKAAKLKLDDATLDRWIENPMAVVPGTLMVFPGIKDPAKRQALIAWLKTQH
jgi:cytochrome c